MRVNDAKWKAGAPPNVRFDSSTFDLIFIDGRSGSVWGRSGSAYADQNAGPVRHWLTFVGSMSTVGDS